MNIHQKENEDKLKSLAQLPDSCEASADCLQQQRAIFEQYNVFSPAMIVGYHSADFVGYEDKTFACGFGRKADGDVRSRT